MRQVEPKQDYSNRIYSWQLDQIPSDDEIHDKLIHAFQQYYIANLVWIQQGTKKSGKDARYWLYQIFQLSKQQRKIILDWIKKISDKSNRDRNYKPTTKKYRKFLQIQSRVDPSKDN